MEHKAQRRTRWGVLSAAAIILLMIAAAELFRVPEITALAARGFLMPKLLWMDAGPVKFVALMTAFGIRLAPAFLCPYISGRRQAADSL